jgi:hypothetical protein
MSTESVVSQYQLGSGMFSFLLPHVGGWMEKTISLFGDQEGWAGRQGGAFCLADARTGLFHGVALLGLVAPDKVAKYLEFCQEKAQRLARELRHSSSWESRDPGLRQWGGAIRCGQIILSFSGLPELGDEALMLKVAMEIQHMGKAFGLTGVPSDLDFIAYLSVNPFWKQLREAA